MFYENDLLDLEREIKSSILKVVLSSIEEFAIAVEIIISSTDFLIVLGFIPIILLFLI